MIPNESHVSKKSSHIVDFLCNKFELQGGLTPEKRTRRGIRFAPLFNTDIRKFLMKACDPV